MYLEPFPPCPSTDQGRLLHIEPKSQTPHHTLGLQHYEVPIKNAKGEVVEWARHDWDLIVPKVGSPGMVNDKDWERVMETPEELAGLKYKRVVRVRYRHKVTGVVVSLRPSDTASVALRFSAMSTRGILLRMEMELM